MPYKTELHMHTSDVSPCARSTPEQAVADYRAAGYRTIVVTNHMNRSTFEHMRDASWQEQMEWYVQARKAILQYAREDFTILLGFELRFDGCDNDYLIYGASDEFLLTNGDLMGMNPAAFSELAHRSHLLMYQAHPFRYHMTLVKEQYLDGVEAYNGNIRHDSHNFLTVSWADYARLPMTSGSDYHRPGDPCNGGIQTETPITTQDELLRVLRTKNYTLLRGAKNE